MNDGRSKLTPEQVAHLRKLSEMIAWLFYEERRPGLLGASERIVGRSNDGTDMVLVRSGAGWTLYADKVVLAEYRDMSETLEVIPNHGFEPRSVVVIPRFADMLFRGAIEQAEAGLNSYLQSVAITIRSHREKVGELLPKEFLARILKIPIGGPVDAATGMRLLDLSVRQSIAAIVLAISAAESQVNEWVDALGGWSNSEDAKSLVRKLKILAAKSSQTLDIGSAPFQDLNQCVKFRNQLVHPKPYEQEISLVSSQEPGRDLSLRARRTCLRVRESLVRVADVLQLERPAYLAYCPPGDFSQDDIWGTASLLTGVREDPDFPRRPDRTSG